MVTEFEELLKAQEEQLSPGSIVKGSVVKITDSNVYIDIGYKIEGIIRKHEIGDVEIGQEVEAVIIKLRGLENPILSTKPLKSSKGFVAAKKAMEDKTPIEITIDSKVRNGFLAQFEDIKVFMPFSEAPKNVKVGDKLNVLITKAIYENGKPMVNVSYKEYEYIEKKAKQQEFINSLEVGSTIEGKVVKVDPSKGVTVLLKENVRGFVPSYEIPKGTQLKEGDTLELRVVKKAKKGDFLILSLKKPKKSPWETFDLKEGDKTEGKVSFYRKGKGLFVELNEGITALVPEENMQNINTKSLKRGTKLKLVITKLDRDKKRVDVNILTSDENPAAEFVKANPPNTVVKGKVKTVHPNIAFIELAPNVEGIVKKQDMSWFKNARSEEILTPNEEREFMVLGLDGKKVKLGLKQLTQNPWSIIPQKYKPGQQVELMVKEVRPFGTFLELPEGIDGLLPISEIPKNTNLEPGQKINVKVLEVNPKEEKITFSMIQQESKKQQKEQKDQNDFIKVNDSSSGFKLGDILKNKLK
ncbi:S1 RNA-binding domain-containing protein [Hydrogenobaculum acidophilum]